jgi:SdpI/YfhL protein family
MLLLMLMYTISGCLLTALSIPLILGKIGPNPWYGFRVKKTLSDPAIWYPANAYAGKRLFVLGLAAALGWGWCVCSRMQGASTKPERRSIPSKTVSMTLPRNRPNQARRTD